jgi:hypothetical protein
LSCSCSSSGSFSSFCRFLAFLPLQPEPLERILRYIVASLDSDSPKFSYIGVFLSKVFGYLGAEKTCIWAQEHSLPWIGHIKQLAAAVSRSLAELSTDSPSYHRRSASLVRGAQ